MWKETTKITMQNNCTHLNRQDCCRDRPRLNYFSVGMLFKYCRTTIYSYSEY
uniref:Uncharacterized protein n=1 Tax=Anguilla anguilla TaxID=7936 RepID=A0A0E9PST0_ANGAN